MIQKFFEKRLMETFAGFMVSMNKFFETNKEILDRHTQELKEIRDAFKVDGVKVKWDTCAGSVISCNIKEDYFTKEYINEEASNTKKLFVVNQTGGFMRTELFKEGNQTKEVKVIKGNNYLFID